jgi:hypothetical protein
MCRLRKGSGFGKETDDADVEKGKRDRTVQVGTRYCSHVTVEVKVKTCTICNILI